MSNSRGDTNYYEILEISPDVPQTEIQKAYQRAKQTYSQDNPALYSMFTREEARELVRLIEEAYRVLGNAATRQSYDEVLRGAARQSMGAIGLAGQHSAQQARSHDALPDFAIPEAGEIAYESHAPTKSQPAPASVPAPQQTEPLTGMGRTMVGAYKMDEAFEEQIKTTEEFDGPLLKKIRLYKNISIDQVSEFSRVSRAYLGAIEDENFQSLPAAVFVRGFIIQIARILGIDENKVANSYMKRFKAAVGKK